MQDFVYHTQYELEQSYWWFVARNQIVRQFIKKFYKAELDSCILDIGCGPGAFSKLISHDYPVVGIDTSELAVEYARKRGLENIFLTDLKSFDTSKLNIGGAMMLDVVEHIEDDAGVLKELYSKLPSDAWFFATVPAYQWLWSVHDNYHMHYRRYTKNQFIRLLKNAGFEIHFSSYFNSLLMPFAVAKRYFDKITGKKQNNSPIDEVPGFINSIFKNIFLLEKQLLKFMKFPCGVSILVVARKK